MANTSPSSSENDVALSKPMAIGGVEPKQNGIGLDLHSDGSDDEHHHANNGDVAPEMKPLAPPEFEERAVAYSPDSQKRFLKYDIEIADLPTYEHSFAGQDVQFGRILLYLAGQPPYQSVKMVSKNQAATMNIRRPPLALSYYCTFSIPPSIYWPSFLS